MNALISRIVDGEATAREWQAFENAAAQNQSLWRHLAMTQRDHAALAQELTAALALADDVELPQIVQHEPIAGRVHFNRFGAWTGWAVAALVAIVAWVQTQGPNAPSVLPQSIPMHTAGLPIQTAAEAFQAYLQKGWETGEVVGEIPERLLVESRPALSGNGFEVIYVRQVMERTIVPDLYRIGGQDEAGRPTLVRYTPTVRTSL